MLRHASTTFPSSKRSIVVPVRVTRFLVATAPPRSPSCVIVATHRVTTLSPSATWSSIAIRMSGNAARFDAIALLRSDMLAIDRKPEPTRR